jgi:glycosyltransferase involved in cell wall biosynthesis
LKIAVIGPRGIQVEGGIETYCRNIYPEICRRGHEVVVFSRARYDRSTSYDGVALWPLPSLPGARFETLSYAVQAVALSALRSADVVHVHGVGSSLVVPIARIFGLGVVVRHVGTDWDKPKWGAVGRMLFRLGERLACRYADVLVCLHDAMADEVRARNRPAAEVSVIFNAVAPLAPAEGAEDVRNLGLEEGRFVLGVGRLSAEKCFETLIEGFRRSGLAEGGWRLAIAGDLSRDTRYIHDLRARAEDAPGVRLIGVAGPARLAQLYDQAGLFVVASRMEGMSFALLEAMVHGAPCLASNLSANRAVCGPQGRYFPVGDVSALADALVRAAALDWPPEKRARQIAMIRARHDIADVAQRTSAQLQRATDLAAVRSKRGLLKRLFAGARAA